MAVTTMLVQGAGSSVAFAQNECPNSPAPIITAVRPVPGDMEIDFCKDGKADFRLAKGNPRNLAPFVDPETKRWFLAWDSDIHHVELVGGATRRESGQGKSTHFYVGESVRGFRAIFADGRDYCGDVYIPAAPAEGDVWDGVAGILFPKETAGVPVTDLSRIHRLTSNNGDQPVHFVPGDIAFGWAIRLDDGIGHDGGVVVFPPTTEGGWVTAGGTNPCPGDEYNAAAALRNWNTFSS